MSDVAIQVEGVSKLYHIGKSRTYKTARETIMNALSLPARLLSRREEDHSTDLWALRDVSFDVKRGEVIGIIGRNGAGKSTLLKVLSRITEPTAGRITLKGRVGSLLEVGTGFHPELTGRENIFLNGAILGMRRGEIARKFDEIVDFSEVEKFIDTPVKHYSSGMYTRLAFAVAAHLEPEILIVDEVLAVGDAEFQRKCLGKMGDVAKQGRTVLFVSHNMGAIVQMCHRAVLMAGGQVAQTGPAATVVADYFSNNADRSGVVDLRNATHRGGNGAVRFESARVTNAAGNATSEFAIGDDLCLEFTLRRLRPAKTLSIAVELATSDGLKLANMVDIDSGFSLSDTSDVQTLRVRLRDLRLYPGAYLMGLFVGSSGGIDTYDYVTEVIRFDVVSGGKLTTRFLPRSAGLLFLTPTWESVGPEIAETA